MSSFLNQQVLVLNRLWQAVHICTARRAITLLFEGRAQVVLQASDGSFQTFSFSEWKDFSKSQATQDCIKSISFRVRVPTVIVLLLFDRLPKKEVKFTRHNIFERDGDKCQYLWAHIRSEGFEFRSCYPAGSRWPDDMGEYRLLLHRLQYAQSQSYSGRSQNALGTQTQAPKVAALRPSQRRFPL